MDLSRVISEILNVEKYRDLEIPVEPVKVIESGTFQYTGYGSLLVFYSNFVPKTHHFWDIRLQKCRDLENGVRGPSRSRSLKMSPFVRAHTVIYPDPPGG